MKYNKLTDYEKRVIIDKQTEPPGSGKYNKFFKNGIYLCKRCNAALFISEDKFDAGCGWPSFDDAIDRSIKKIPDADGLRTEILCNRCDAHLGHIFTGEQFTTKNTRYCVNSVSLSFVSEEKLEKAYFAGGCFWGVEYYFQSFEGVILTQVGYMGGKLQNPTYDEVCAGETGHYETTQVIYDPTKTDFEELAKLFFQIHDPTQVNGQGHDIGKQYHSAIFYINDAQKQIAEKLIKILNLKGYKVATKLIKAGRFWKAESYHQHYYLKTEKYPYCHSFVKRF